MGPVCQIMLERPLDQQQIEVLEGYITSIGKIASSSLLNWNFLIHIDSVVSRSILEQGCMFSIGISNQPEDCDESEKIETEERIGFYPAASLQLDAYCNDRIDHLLLAKVASELMQKFNGYIHFCGELPRSAEALDGLFTINDDMRSRYHIADRQFLESWMLSEDFHMIK